MYSDLSQQSLNALAKRMQAGDERAFEVFCSDWKDYISFRVSEKIRNHEDAEEITNGTFHKIWELTQRGYWDGSFDFVYFVLGIIKREVKWQRNKLCRRDTKAQRSSGAYEYATASVFLCESTTHYNELDAAVDAALLKLTSNQRLAFILRYREGYKLKEIGRILKAGRGGVHYYINCARRNLQKLLADFNPNR